MSSIEKSTTKTNELTMAPTFRRIKIITQNIQSLFNKEELRYKPDELVCLQEMVWHAQQKELNWERISWQFPEHSLIKSTDGRIGILVPKNIKTFGIRTHEINEKGTFLSLDIAFSYHQVTIVNCYRSHTYCQQEVFLRDLKAFLSTIKKPKIVVGDFNMRIGKLKDLIADEGLKVKVLHPKQIDFILFDQKLEQAISNLERKDDGVSDHAKLTCDLNLVHASRPQFISPFPRNLSKVQKRKINGDTEINSVPTDIDPLLFEETMEKIFCRLFPPREQKNRYNKYKGPMDSIRERRRWIVKRNRISKRDPDQRDESALKEAKNQIQKLTKQIRNQKRETAYESWKNYCEKSMETLPKSNLFRFITGKRIRQVQTMTNAKETSCDPQHMAEMFEEFCKELYTSKFVDSPALNRIIQTIPAKMNIREESKKLMCPFTSEEVENTIKNLGDKAPGPFLAASQRDVCGLSPSVIKALPFDFTEMLNKMWKWNPLYNIAFLMPIPKDKSDLVEKHRPIMVAPTIVRIFNKIMKNRMQKLLASLEIIPANQYGWVKGVSAPELVADIMHYYRKLGDPVLISFDLAKAFDSLEYRTLEKILDAIGFDSSLVDLLISQQSSIKVKCRIKGQTGQGFTTGRGVKQGDPLSPFLFKIYMLPLMLQFDAKRRQQCRLLKDSYFADDSSILCEAQMAQAAIDLFVKTAEILSLRTNADKTWGMSKKPHTFKIGNTSELITGPEKTGRLLGFHLDGKLNMKQEKSKIKHFVKAVIANARRIQLKDPIQLISLVNPVLRGFLNYHGSVVWIDNTTKLKLDSQVRAFYKKKNFMLNTLTPAESIHYHLGLVMPSIEMTSIYQSTAMRMLNSYASPLGQSYRNYMDKNKRKELKAERSHKWVSHLVESLKQDCSIEKVSCKNILPNSSAKNFLTVNNRKIVATDGSYEPSSNKLTAGVIAGDMKFAVKVTGPHNPYTAELAAMFACIQVLPPDKYLFIIDNQALCKKLKTGQFSLQNPNRMGRMIHRICQFLISTSSEVVHIYSHGKNNPASRIAIEGRLGSIDENQFSKIMNLNAEADKQASEKNPKFHVKACKDFIMISKGKTTSGECKDWKKINLEPIKSKAMAQLDSKKRKGWDRNTYLIRFWDKIPLFGFLDDLRKFLKLNQRKMCPHCSKGPDSINHLKFCSYFASTYNECFKYAAKDHLTFENVKKDESILEIYSSLIKEVAEAKKPYFYRFIRLAYKLY